MQKRDVCYVLVGVCVCVCVERIREGFLEEEP